MPACIAAGEPTAPGSASRGSAAVSATESTPGRTEETIGTVDTVASIPAPGKVALAPDEPSTSTVSASIGDWTTPTESTPP